MSLAAINGNYRRGKTALFLTACIWIGAFPHWMSPTIRMFPAITFALLLGGYGLRTVFLSDRSKLLELANDKSNEAVSTEQLPAIDILVAAKDEEAVIKQLVEHISSLSYPKERISTWIIDDGSQDKTPILLEELSHKFKNVHIINRPVNAGGGKSGALNQALKEANGEWLFILDADAQLQQDSLRRLMLYALNSGSTAVQLRKAVLNPFQNSLTKFQAMEMAMDAVIQQGRLVNGCVVELRGNGQLINRRMLDKCGGFNEETITDDLDLSFRLLISGALVGILWNPPVEEEAVETVAALWRQRQRWAEGGLQRFFDYFPLLISSQISFHKKRDLACFFLLQYALPVVSFVDIIIGLLTKSFPTFWPLSIVAFSVSGFAFWRGCKIVSEGPILPSPKPLNIVLAILYLAHWFIVIPWVTIRMVIFPKQLVWAKTNHHG